MVIPNHYKDYMEARQFDKVKAFNKEVLPSGRKLVTFTKRLEYKPQKGELVFAVSTYRSPDKKSLLIPNWLFDIGPRMKTIPKLSIPTVGFVGYTEYPGKFNSIIRYLPVTDSFVDAIAGNLSINRNLNMSQRQVIARWVRKRSLNALRECPNLKASIIERMGDFFVLPPAEKIP